VLDEKDPIAELTASRRRHGSRVLCARDAFDQRRDELMFLLGMETEVQRHRSLVPRAGRAMVGDDLRFEHDGPQKPREGQLQLDRRADGRRVIRLDPCFRLRDLEGVRNAGHALVQELGTEKDSMDGRPFYHSMDSHNSLIWSARRDSPPALERYP